MAQRRLGAPNFPYRRGSRRRTVRQDLLAQRAAALLAMPMSAPLCRSHDRRIDGVFLVGGRPHTRQCLERGRPASPLPLPGSEVRMNVPAIEADAAVPVVMALGWIDVDLDLRVRGGDLAYASAYVPLLLTEMQQGRNAWHGYLIAPRPRYRCRPLARNECARGFRG